MEIRLVKKEINKDASQVDIIEVKEVKYRTSPAKLLERKSYLETNISNWTAELEKVNTLIAQVYGTIEK
jgi:hypothetical protein